MELDIARSQICQISRRLVFARRARRAPQAEWCCPVGLGRAPLARGRPTGTPPSPPRPWAMLPWNTLHGWRTLARHSLASKEIVARGRCAPAPPPPKRNPNAQVQIHCALAFFAQKTLLEHICGQNLLAFTEFFGGLSFTFVICADLSGHRGKRRSDLELVFDFGVPLEALAHQKHSPHSPCSMNSTFQQIPLSIYYFHSNWKSACLKPLLFSTSPVWTDGGKPKCLLDGAHTFLVPL